MVAVRLIVVSLVVGLVLETFGFDPSTLISDAVRSARAIVELGFTDIHEIGRILMTGAMVVVPVWLALRLLEFEPGAVGERPIGSRARAFDGGLDAFAPRWSFTARGILSSGQMLMAFSHPLARGAKVWTAIGSGRRRAARARHCHHDPA